MNLIIATALVFAIFACLWYAGLFDTRETKMNLLSDELDKIGHYHSPDDDVATRLRREVILARLAKYEGREPDPLAGIRHSD